MKEVINDFPNQFRAELKLERGDSLTEKGYVIVSGMGGSGLAADFIRAYDKSMPVLVHKNYGLPDLDDEILKESISVVTSFSGDTEEALSALGESLDKNISTIAITKGGQLMAIAKEKRLPLVTLPDVKIPSRMALGYHLIGLLTALGEESLLKEFRALADLDFYQYENVGKDLTDFLNGRIPVIYSSERNNFIPYIWKINFNETSKTPAFMNSFPELTHGEIAGFEDKGLSERFTFIFIDDADDHIEIQKKMISLKKVYEDKGLDVLDIPMRGVSRLERIFSSIITSYWASYFFAVAKNVDPFRANIIEEFKKY